MRSILFMLMLISSMAASATTISFDLHPAVTGSGNGASLEYEGAVFTITNPGNEPSSFIADSSLRWCPDCSMSMELSSGNTFAMSSIDVAFFGPEPATVTITGILLGGGIVETTYSGPSFGTFETVVLGTSWTGLESIQFVTDVSSATIINNLVISAVPIPAAVWLFGSALAGLGWMRRR